MKLLMTIYPEIGKLALRKSQVLAVTLQMIVLCEILL